MKFLKPSHWGGFFVAVFTGLKKEASYCLANLE